MSDPEASSDNVSSKSNVGKLLAGLMVVLAIGAIIFFVVRGDDNGLPGFVGGDDSELQERLELTRTALASTENLETLEADQSWSTLLQQDTQDRSVALNRAINRVLRVDQLAEQATDANLQAEEKQTAREELTRAIPSAREAIDEYNAIEDDVVDLVTPLWLRSRVDLQEASLLPKSIEKSMLTGLFDKLSEAITGEIGEDPRGMILGGPLTNVIEKLDYATSGGSAQFMTKAAKTLATLSDRNPDNLFFAMRAASLNVASKNKKAAELVKRAKALSLAIEPSIRRNTMAIGVTPDELVNQIIEAVESGDWNEADYRLGIWSNVLMSSELVKTDRRRSSPHPLDRLSFDTLRRLSVQVAEASPLEQSSSQLQFEAQKIASNVIAARTVDFDLDLDADLVTLSDDGTLQLWSNDGSAAFAAAGELKLDNQPIGIIVADLFAADASDPQRIKVMPAKPKDGEQPSFASSTRHDTLECLVAFGAKGVEVIQIDGRSTTDDDARLKLVENSGIEDISDVTAAIAGDLEADGDLDLVIATKSQGVRLFANRGNRTFFELVQPGGAFAVDDPVTAMAIGDIDRDLDLDVVTVHAGSGRVGLLENLLHLQFRGRFLDEIDAVEGASSIAIEDIDGNVSWDLIVGGTGGTSLVFTQTADAGAWTVDRVEKSDQEAARLAVADFDNDSWIELIACGADESAWCRIGPWGFSDWQTAPAVSDSASPTAADLNGDWLIDVVGVQDQQVGVLLNQTDSPGHHIDVRFKGIDDNRSGRVNHYAIGSVLEMRFGPHYRARIVNSPSTHFGTDGFDAASSVRAILPNGLTQTIRNPPIDSVLEEEQTLKGSCPYLYAWDGEKYVFQTDCLWAAPLGLQVARGVVAKDRPWEYLKIDGTNIRPRGDRYEFRITEELWEVAYFDKVALSVVDHPAEVDVWTNEKVGPAEIATPTIFAFDQKSVHQLRSAKDTFGRDVTDQLTHADRDFVQGFDRRFRQGLCPPHWIDMDFGKQCLEGVQGSDARVYLVLTGWILPTDTSLNIQIDQNPDLGPIEFPSVWVPDATTDNGWRKAIEAIGFPGGKTKTIVVDVTDAITPDDPRLRVRTSAQIYWDNAQLAVQSQPAEYRTEEVALLKAEVGYHGFSERIRQDSTVPETYDYQQPTLTPRWPPLRGRVTQFGECLELVREWDDAMVVIGSGDEIQLEFAVPETPLPDGWKRDFVFHSVGWDKDADLNTLRGQSIGPLPYREMTEYPPPVGEASDQRERLNQPHLQRTQSFRSFWYRGEFDDRPDRFLRAKLTVQ